MKIRHQCGVALILSLLLLVAITLLVVTSMRDSGTQERMTANMTERSISFQLVEATLIFAQNTVVAVDPTVICNIRPGYYCQPIPGQLDRWNDPATVWSNDGPDYDLVGQGEFIAEYMGQWVNIATPDCAKAGQADVLEDCLRDTWRITARTNANDGAAVMLQVIFRMP